MQRAYYVYVVSNQYRTVLYIGVTNDLGRRLREHRDGRGSTFTTKYRATDLIYYEEYRHPQDAIRREKQLKGWTRQKKLDLIHTLNPELKDLAKQL